MRALMRHSPWFWLWLLMIPNLVVSTGSRGEGLASGCFAPPTFSHSRGLSGLNDVIVFATASPDTLQVYSISQARVTSTMKTLDRLQDMALSPTDPQSRPRPRAYVSTKTARIAAYDLLRYSVLDEVRLSTDPDASGGPIAVSGDGKYVATGIGDLQFQIRDITILDADDLRRQVAHFNIGGDLQDLIANPNPDVPELYVINDRASRVRIFDFSTLTLQDRILDLTGSPSDFAISPDGRLAMASINARNKVVFLDLEAKQLVYEVELPNGNPHRIAFDPRGNFAYVTDRKVTKSVLYRFDLAPLRQALARRDFSSLDQATVVSEKQIPSLLLNAAYVPEGAAVSSDGNFLYLSGSNQTRFSVVNLEPLNVIMEAKPQYSWLETLASQQLSPDVTRGLTNHDGMFEVQALNLAKDPVTFSVLRESGLVFSFTSEVGKKDGQPPVQ